MQLDESQWLQTGLPVKLGGLGIPSVANTSSGAFLSSCFRAAGLVSQLCGEPLKHQFQDAAIDHWRLLGGKTVPSHPEKQRAWMLPLQKLHHEELSSRLDNVGRSRLNGCSSPGSGDWINALPSSKLGLRLNDNQLRIGIAMRLGSPVSYPHKCVCGVEADGFGHHKLCCRRSSGRHARHSALNHIIQRAMTAATVPSTLEPVGLSRNDGKRPDGLTLTPWARGRCLVWDATCTHRLAPTYTALAALPGATVAGLAEKRKWAKYEAMAETHIVQPLAFETIGGIGPSTWKFIQQLGALLSSRLKDPNQTTYLRQRLGVAIQVGNAACILERPLQF